MYLLGNIGTSGYGYSIRKESLDLLAPNIKIDDYLKSNDKNLTEDEAFIKEIYDFYKQKDKYYKDSIYKDKYTHLKIFRTNSFCYFQN